MGGIPGLGLPGEAIPGDGGSDAVSIDTSASFTLGGTTSLTVLVLAPPPETGLRISMGARQSAALDWQ